MAQRNVPVFLGYEDEIINEKYKDSVNFTINKIGGTPDFPSNITVSTPFCGLCKLPQPLIIQIYAPLENDTNHRTLYVFACINPSCWNQNESWCCLRAQTTEGKNAETFTKQLNPVSDWCQDADNWDDECNANLGEENGNLIGAKASDEDEDESFSYEDDHLGFGGLTIDDRNANFGLSEAQGGAVGKLNSPTATAEIEGNEGEVISVDTPTQPKNDLLLLLQEHEPLPKELQQKSTLIQFQPYFMSVYEENKTSNGSDHHIRELLQEYQRHNDVADLNFISEEPSRTNSEDNATIEKYEEDDPIHGDKMFHYFSNKVQENPGQLLRYSRESLKPLLLCQLQDIPRSCSHCQGELVFEFQILPTLIPKLHLITDVAGFATRLEFGNVLVFTCKRSCWGNDGIRVENVVVQREIF
nr:programmed cell death protein 2-like [Onthophagus taurus]